MRRRAAATRQGRRLRVKGASHMRAGLCSCPASPVDASRVGSGAVTGAPFELHGFDVEAQGGADSADVFAIQPLDNGGLAGAVKAPACAVARRLDASAAASTRIAEGISRHSHHEKPHLLLLALHFFDDGEQPHGHELCCREADRCEDRTPKAPQRFIWLSIGNRPCAQALHG
jgi:hypothetical protein